jgi:hypothetical protein
MLVILRYAEFFFLIGRSFKQEYQIQDLFFLLKTQYMAMQEMTNTNMGTKSKGVDISILQVWTTHHSFFTLDHMLNN